MFAVLKIRRKTHHLEELRIDFNFQHNQSIALLTLDFRNEKCNLIAWLTRSSSSSDSNFAIGANAVHCSVSSSVWLNDENFEHLHEFVQKNIWFFHSQN